MISDALRTFSNGRKDDWDAHLPLTAFAINNAALTLGGSRGQHPRLPLSLPDLRSDNEPPLACAARMMALEQEVLALLHAAQQERMVKLDLGLVDTRFQVVLRWRLRALTSTYWPSPNYFVNLAEYDYASAPHVPFHPPWR